MNQSATIRWEVEQQHAVVTDRSAINIPKFLYAFHAAVFLSMIKPTGTDRYIGFGRDICITAFYSFVQPFIVLPFISDAYRVGSRPTRITGFAGLISHPTHIGKRIRVLGPENDTVRLLLSHNLIPMGIDGSSQFVCSGTVPPSFPDFSIVTHQFFQLVTIILLVLLRSIKGRKMLVPVVRTQIDARLNAILLASIHKLAHNVSLSILPGRVLHSIIRIFTGPKAKPIGMFGCNDGTGDTGRLKGTHPLSAIEGRRIEYSCRSTSVPFVYILLKGIDPEVKESDHLPVIPLYLSRTGSQPVGFGGLLPPYRYRYSSDSRR